MAYVIVILILQICLVVVVLSNLRLARSYRALIAQQKKLIDAKQEEVDALRNLVDARSKLIESLRPALPPDIAALVPR